MILLVLSVNGLPVASAYNAAGHRLVAMIAYQQLTPKVRRKLDAVTLYMFPHRAAELRFVEAAVWPDAIKRQEVSAFNHWHYINLQLMADGQWRHKKSGQVVWAIEQSEQVWLSHRSSLKLRAMFVAFLAHFVADVHQPLHCDGYLQGGNDFAIRAGRIHNLHCYWDLGGGFLVKPAQQNKRTWLQQLAARTMKRYPKKFFSRALQQPDPMRWAQHQYRLARQFAFAIQPNSRPTPAYRKRVQQLTQRNCALAGYRLAQWLNRL